MKEGFVKQFLFFFPVQLTEDGKEQILP